MDETVYKRSNSGKKISRKDSRVKKLKFNNKTVTITQSVKIGRIKAMILFLQTLLFQDVMLSLRLKTEFTQLLMQAALTVPMLTQILSEKMKRKNCSPGTR